MQKAIPYKSPWIPIYPNSVFNRENDDQTQTSHVSSSSSSASCKRSSMVMENAVVMIARRGCCMGHVAKRLLLTHGVNPLVNEVGDDEDEANVLSEFGKIVIGGGKEEKIENLPLVFIGGKLFGGLDKLMAAHINGDLVPLLKQAGALWL